MPNVHITSRSLGRLRPLGGETKVHQKQNSTSTAGPGQCLYYLVKRRAEGWCLEQQARSNSALALNKWLDNVIAWHYSTANATVIVLQTAFFWARFHASLFNLHPRHKWNNFQLKSLVCFSDFSSQRLSWEAEFQWVGHLKYKYLRTEHVIDDQFQPQHL